MKKILSLVLVTSVAFGSSGFNDDSKVNSSHKLSSEQSRETVKRDSFENGLLPLPDGRIDMYEHQPLPDGSIEPLPLNQ
ncbi:hypothetical protein [Pontibacillus yanchengensis]|uniref:Uncharacterized protein n=1 Tax=Pontibacillus yanchengensis Y32 TaxID=1385514 RepID=A0A0A2T5M2_9BACI|nr:hypothetical protein [Pontibacillus yanchengensis]KGP71102.1 hypothetical protein N782_01555 [Pontibacillus yanchengensis Y32]